MLGSLFYGLFLLFQQHHGPPHTFEDVEKWAREFEDPARDEWQKPDEVVRALALRPGDRVADIGAGSGYFSHRFARAVEPAGAVYAVDIEPEMLRYIAQRAKQEGLENIVPVLARPDDPMLPPGVVDVVFICNTIHHIENRESYYRTLKRDLASGGRLVVIDFQRRDGIPVGPSLEMRIAKEELVRELARAGFRFREEKLILPYQYFLVFEIEPAG